MRANRGACLRALTLCAVALAFVACVQATADSVEQPKKLEFNTGKAKVIIDFKNGAVNIGSSSSGSGSSSSGSGSSESSSSESSGSSSGSGSSSSSDSSSDSSSSSSDSDSSSSDSSSSSGSSSGSSSSQSSSSQSGSLSLKRNEEDLLTIARYILPPEPAAAKGYRPYPRCRPKDPCAKNQEGPQENDEEENDLSTSGSSSSLSASSFDAAASSSLSSSSSSGSSSESETESESRDDGSQDLESGFDLEENVPRHKKKELCIENCDAEELSDNRVLGPVFSSQPLGDVENGGLKPVQGTQTKATGLDEFIVVPQSGGSCGCDVCPCSQPIVSTPILPPLSLVAPVSTCGCAVCPCQADYARTPKHEQDAPASFDSVLASNCNDASCPQYETPLEQHARRVAAFQEKVRQERERERQRLHEDLAKHQDNMSKIDRMTRTLRYQYGELRRQHMALRAQLSANKLNLRTMGDDEYKGTEFDIEGPPPADVEDITDVKPILGVNSDWAKMVNKALAKQFQRNVQALSSAQRKQKNNLSGFLKLQNEQTQSKPSKRISKSVSAALKSLSSSKADAYVKHALLSLVSAEKNPPPSAEKLMSSDKMKELVSSMDK